MKPSWLFLLPGFLMMFLFNSRARTIQQESFDPAAIDQFIARQIAAQRIPGLGLAITRGNEVLYVQGYGTAGNGQPVTPRTQFFIASLSKSFTATAVMQLVEAGRIDLDAPVQTYLPEFTLSDPEAARQITIRHLLNHTSGLSDLGFPEMVLPQPDSISAMVSSLGSARPAARPGREFHYFNPNYAILARVVEVVSGQPFSVYLENNIFTPLEMQHTLSVITTNEGKAKADTLAQGHLIAFGIPFVYPEPNGYHGGSGGIVTTAEDMAHYLITQAGAGRYQGGALISAESLERMHTPPLQPDSHYAMGWMESTFNGKRILEHTGVISTYSSDAVLIPEDQIGIALLYNISSLPTNSFGTPQIRNGVMALTTGSTLQTSWMSVGVWGWITTTLTLTGGFLAVRSLRQLPRWSQKTRGTPAWRLIPSILWAYLPLLALLGMPALSARFADRVFGFVNFYKAMLGIFTWLGLTGVLGAINGTMRAILLLRRQRED